jgi:FkbM family methyltransferase
MTDFKHDLAQVVKSNLYNDFGAENYSEERFGSLSINSKITQVLKNKVKKIIRYKEKEQIESQFLKITPYLEELEAFYSLLTFRDKKLLLDLLAYRVLGFRKVKLPTNSNFYKESIKKAEKLIQIERGTLDPNFIHYKLNFFNLNPIGYDVQLFFTKDAIAIDFIIEQYVYKNENREAIVEAEKGDFVLDLGGCWGDTALYFASKVGDDGKVFSFEFIPNNVEIFNKNIHLNSSLKERIKLIQNPVSDASNQIMYYVDKGPSSVISLNPILNENDCVKTISIDDFVKNNQIEKVDFIKMDIEGAEQMALNGAIKTIKKFKPKLAIAIYHSMDDFSRIPNWINDLGMDYKLYLGHYTIHSEETIIFAV